MPTPIVRNKLEHFDRWSLTYEDSWLQRYLFDRVHRAVLTLVEHRVEPHAILDVGCGTGRLLRAARAKWPDARLVGIDPSRGMIDVAHRLTPSAAFHLGSAEEIPLPDASVDLALSTMSFHHWRDQVAGLHEVVRVLGHGGYFYLADFSAPTWLLQIIHQARFQDPAHLRTVFTKTGLKLLDQRSVAPRFVLVTVGVTQEAL